MLRWYLSILFNLPTISQVDASDFLLQSSLSSWMREGIELVRDGRLTGMSDQYPSVCLLTYFLFDHLLTISFNPANWYLMLQFYVTPMLSPLERLRSKSVI
jgi:hypothetical protein